MSNDNQNLSSAADRLGRRLRPRLPTYLRALGLDAASLGKQGDPARTDVRPKRNDPCPCESGRKFKRCCGSES